MKLRLSSLALIALPTIVRAGFASDDMFQSITYLRRNTADADEKQAEQIRRRLSSVEEDEETTTAPTGTVENKKMIGIIDNGNGNENRVYVVDKNIQLFDAVEVDDGCYRPRDAPPGHHHNTKIEDYEPLDVSTDGGSIETIFNIGTSSDPDNYRLLWIELGTQGCSVTLGSQRSSWSPNHDTILQLSCVGFGGGNVQRTWDGPVFKDGLDHILTIEWDNLQKTISATIDEEHDLQLDLKVPLPNIMYSNVVSVITTHLQDASENPSLKVCPVVTRSIHGTDYETGVY
jgi:hypothetical protein